MATIVISHTAPDGTLVDGDTEKGDGTGDILKRYGFRWFRSLRQYGIPQSRDRAPRVVAMEAAADELRAAGHEVTVEIDGEVRDNTTVRAAQHERLEDRREALGAKQEKLTQEAEALRRRSDAMVEHLPLGQPVMPGPRGRAHRNLLERSVDTSIRSALTAQEAERMPARIEGSRRAEAYKERPDVTARRVDRLETELRALDRRMAGLSEHNSPRLLRQYQGERAVLVERIAGDRAVLDAAREAGTFGRYSKDNVHRDDQVKIRGQWRTVARANGKTVSVTTGYSWTDRYGWEEVRDLRCQHAPAAEDTPDN
ncbi:DUF3560 domain-containing protein [Streptomyces sp. NBC_01233]|uniref:DUF3560 domain-containing protein n=1 Tax=Streptomyces sp. NBC_01233 TaxID=2903787 RepID=UPI002E0ED654|nr:DUF3560 domain-containing protein [Streptomyces sp. NBC_01233]